MIAAIVSVMKVPRFFRHWPHHRYRGASSGKSSSPQENPPRFAGQQRNNARAMLARLCQIKRAGVAGPWKEVEFSGRARQLFLPIIPSTL
jgi:hypothetical protein